MKQEKIYKELYEFSFGFAVLEYKKNVEISTANALWGIFMGTKCSFLEQWQKFLLNKSDKNELNVVTRDVWDSFYDLVK